MPLYEVVTPIDTDALAQLLGAFDEFPHNPAPEKKYQFTLFSEDCKQKLQTAGRNLHGYQSGERIDISTIKNGSCIQKLQNGQDVYLNRTSLVAKSEAPNTQNGDVSIIRGQDIKSRQAEVTVYYDKAKITPQEINDILLIKSGKGNFTDAQKKDLESKASYYVMRAKIKQYYAVNEKGMPFVLNQPIMRVLYFTCFPNLLSKQSQDFENFANPNGTLKDPEALKIKLKTILRLNQMVAAEHKEGFFVLTPNMFFSGLQKPEQKIAKQIFAQAIVEVAAEDRLGQNSFLGFFVNDDNQKSLYGKITEQYWTVLKAQFIIGINLDASAPQRAAQAEGISDCIAEPIMGHPLHPAGNFALSGFHGQPKEEIDYLLTAGEPTLMFNQTYNPKLQEQNSYVALDIVFKNKLRIPIPEATSILEGQSSSAAKPIITTNLYGESQKTAESLGLKQVWAAYKVSSLEVIMDKDHQQNQKYVLKVAFQNQSHAQDFANHIEEKTTDKPKVNISENNVFLGQNRCAGYFEAMKLCNPSPKKTPMEYPNGLKVFNELKNDWFKPAANENKQSSGCCIS